MILIICHSYDMEAIALHQQLIKDKQQSTIIFIEALFSEYKLNYQSSIYRTTFELIHIENQIQIQSKQIKIFINRVSNIQYPFTESDQAYANQELFALWCSLISSLECTVLNKPDCISFFGFGYSQMELECIILKSGFELANDFSFHNNGKPLYECTHLHVLENAINTDDIAANKLMQLANLIQLSNFEIALNNESKIKCISALPKYSNAYKFYLQEFNKIKMAS